MIVALHEIIKQLLHEQGNITPSEVDVSFDAPTKEWIQRLVRPTVNCFLYGVQENSDLRQTGFQSSRINGRAERKMPPRRIDLAYMISAHATEKEDEHRLLWRVLATLLHFPELPDERLPDDVQALGVPLAMRVAQEEDNGPLLGLWGGLGVEPHPAIGCVVTAPLDLERIFDSPLVLTRTLRFARGLDGIAEHTDTQIGGIVRDGDGVPVGGVTVAVEGRAVSVLTNAEGAFVLRNVPSGLVRLRVIRPGGAAQIVTTTVPSEMYDIVLT